MDILQQMQQHLGEDDIRQLKDIYEPTQVAVPDADATNGLCVTREGAIRFYGDYRRTFPEPEGTSSFPECYIESKDCGLSWKRHIIRQDVLGKSTYIPFMDKYLGTKVIQGKGFWVRIGDNPDSTEYSQSFIEGNVCDLIPTALVLKKRNRIILWYAETRPQSCSLPAYFPVVHYSDDGGQTWKEVHLGEAPFFEVKWPHKGCRWQQNNREITIIEKEDGTLQCFSRTSMDVLYTATSLDGGETWSEFSPSIFQSTGTFPCAKKLNDGRIVLAFCNTRLLPEVKEANGVWEDFFTNRDANHIAISEDDGQTWKGFRELRLNPLRNNVDFRSVGGKSNRDKSVHQFEILELPFNKLLVANGQHEICRNIMILDLEWLYETDREEDLLKGLTNVSTQSYVKSIAGGWRGEGYIGHCAYNRVSSALLLPSPENNGKEALHIAPLEDKRLLNGYSGAVWNFPASKKGKIALRAYLPGKGLRVSLFDYWVNPIDDTVPYFAPFSIVLRKNMQNDEQFTTFEITFDCESKRVTVEAGDYVKLTFPLNGELPHGLHYLHLQSAVAENDTEGSYVSAWSFESLEKI